MKNFGLKRWVGMMATIAPLLLMSACKQDYGISVSQNGQSGNPTATPPGSGGTPTPTPCTGVQTTTANLRIMFMMDNSGSTVGTSGTDPNYAYRVGAVQSFLNQYGHKPNLTYSFGYFHNDLSKIYDMGDNVFKLPGSNPPISQYFSNAAGTTAALTAFQNLGSSGNTPYQKAFNALGVEVIADEAAHGTTYDYVVVFMSDGQPNPGMNNNDLVSMVNNLKTIVGTNNDLSVSTVYFGPASDSTAIGKLQLMATTGGGQFVNTNVNSTFNINDVIIIPGCTR